MTTVNDLAKLVREMRVAQNDYFAKRTRSALTRSLDLEKKVDRLVLQILGDAQTQPPLFAPVVEVEL